MKEKQMNKFSFFDFVDLNTLHKSCKIHEKPFTIDEMNPCVNEYLKLLTAPVYV